MIVRARALLLTATLMGLLGCSGSSASSASAGGQSSAAGGTINSGGSTGGVTSGDNSGSGGTPTTGGAGTTGSEAVNTGGSPNTNTGSVAVSTGGTRTTGGRSSTGGRPATGGRSATGGSQTAAGTSTSTPATGGSPGTGGTTGSAGGATGSCARPVGTCSAPTVTVTEVSVGSQVTGYGQEGDTDPIPLAIAAMPSGGSRIAWLGTDGNVHIGELDCADELVGTPFTIPGIDLQDLYADDAGGVVLLTRSATNGGTDQCGTGTLCGGTSSPCRTMWMVRFDAAGNVAWETQVTNLSANLAGYQNGARFIWWYQHHGRLAYDGTNYAAYFGVAITVTGANNCVDIHEGDRMQVVGPTGTLLSGHDSFEVGCSHAWTSRLVWDPRVNHFIMVCATDNSCRIARPNPYRTIAAGTCDNTLFGGDLVNSTTTGYWTAWSQGGTIRLQHFTDSAGPDTSVDSAGSSQHPHLVSYGANNMLLTWASGSSQAAQVRDASSGATVGAQFTIGVNDHNYLAYKSYEDGSVAYPASGSNNTSIKIARVMPCQ